MPKFIDLTGNVYGRLTVISRAENSHFGAAKWLVSCSCGKTKIMLARTLRNGEAKGCGCCNRQRGKECPRWKNGKTKTGKGYIQLTDPRELGYSFYHGKQIYEHTAVMAEHLGRELFVSETVHHKNGQKDDNRIENLELYATQHGSGQRISDRIQDAIDFLRCYKPEVLAEVQASVSVYRPSSQVHCVDHHVKL